jgi:hypothetical protein
LLFGRLWTRFCFLAGRGHDFVIRENGFMHCIIFANVVSCTQRIKK